MGMLDCWFTLLHLGSPAAVLEIGVDFDFRLCRCFFVLSFLWHGAWQTELGSGTFAKGSLLEPIYKLLSVRYHFLLFVDQDRTAYGWPAMLKLVKLNMWNKSGKVLTSTPGWVRIFPFLNTCSVQHGRKAGDPQFPSANICFGKENHSAFSPKGAGTWQPTFSSTQWPEQRPWGKFMQKRIGIPLENDTHKWVCLKIGYIPNYSHLIGIMISKTIGFRGLAYFQTNPNESKIIKDEKKYTNIPCSELGHHSADLPFRCPQDHRPLLSRQGAATRMG